MLPLSFQTFVCASLSWIVWCFLRKKIRPTAFDNLPGPKPASILMGSMKEIYDKDGWGFHKNIAAKYGSVMRVKGMFGENQLYVFDPKALYNIFVKDQDIYEESPFFLTFNRLSYGEGLLATLGAQHKKQRKMLNPVFSTAHMRDMVPIFYEVVYKLRKAIGKKVENGPREVEMMTWITRTALELIGQTGIGYSFDSLEEDVPSHRYVKAAVAYIPSVYKLRFIAPVFGPMLEKIGTPAFRRFLVDICPWKALHEARDIVDIMHETSLEIYAEKKQALADGDEALSAKVGQGKDIMSILMRANMSASKEDSLTESELIGQMSSLIFAAMDTTSNALSRTLYLLAQNPGTQERLRQEFSEAREEYGGGDVPFDRLVALPYLDAVCRETLRVYPPVTLTHRVTTQDVVLPLSQPVKGLDGQEIREILLPKNTEITTSLLSSNINPDIWGPDADEWKPERWLSPLPETVTNARIPGVYSNLMTFIGGNRACIGFKFSQLEMKIVLSLLVEAFCFSPSKHEIEWHMNSITSPMIKGSDSAVPLLPLLVERV
ncbi:hypothetical protein D9619_006487 [Psilocybe cf. subviscida]|uniref:Cytochrome P450 n=1 Tax=Psilocybe cf. subviscida TaxID=2480587 RepID=A0A8H5EY68_9AGAR|nr:hypothetical protein D9619_006487 [Psilocybe cf. subviscida]